MAEANETGGALMTEPNLLLLIQELTVKVETLEQKVEELEELIDELRYDTMG